MALKVLTGQWWFGRFGPHQCECFSAPAHAPRPFCALLTFDQDGLKFKGEYADSLGKGIVEGVLTGDDLQFDISYFTEKDVPIIPKLPVVAHLRKQEHGWFGTYTASIKELAGNPGSAQMAAVMLDSPHSASILPWHKMVFPESHLR